MSEEQNRAIRMAKLLREHQQATADLYAARERLAAYSHALVKASQVVGLQGVPDRQRLAQMDAYPNAGEFSAQIERHEAATLALERLKNELAEFGIAGIAWE